MRRILRWAFRILAACSLLLCVACGIAWAWSYRSPIVVQRLGWGPAAAGRSRIDYDAAMAGRGALGLFRMRFSPNRGSDDAALAEIDLILRDRAASMRAGPAVDPAREYGFIPPDPPRPDLPRRLGFRWGSAEWPVYPRAMRGPGRHRPGRLRLRPAGDAPRRRAASGPVPGVREGGVGVALIHRRGAEARRLSGASARGCLQRTETEEPWATTSPIRRAATSGSPAPAGTWRWPSRNTTGESRRAYPSQRRGPRRTAPGRTSIG